MINKLFFIILFISSTISCYCQKKTKYNSLEEALKNPKTALKLIIKGEEITEIPVTIGSLINLKELKILETNISKLPDTLASLQKLQSLSVLYNKQIIVFPEVITKLKKLVELQMAGIGFIPQEL